MTGLSLGNLEGAGAFTVTVPGVAAVAAVVDGLQKNPQTPPANPTRSGIMAGQAGNEGSMAGLTILCCKDPGKTWGHYVLLRVVSISATFHPQQEAIARLDLYGPQ